MLALLFMNRMSVLNRRLEASNRELTKSKRKCKQISEMVCCRTCLSTENLQPLFYEDNVVQKSEELRLVTGLKIDNNDGLSQMICTKCIKTVESTLKFRRKCKKAEKTLIDLLNGKQNKRLKIKTQVQEKVLKRPKPDPELDYDDYGYDGDDFHNEQDFDEDSEDIKPVISEPFTEDNDGDEKSHNDDESKQTGRRKRPHIPNAASYKCATCCKEFRMKATFKAHMRFHTNYCVCESCGKRCRNNNQLQEHKRARHGLGRIHKCAYCEYSSATKEALTIHERRHTGERPYICDHCGATFHRRSNLVQHIAIHLPEKNFQCDMCPKRLKSKKFLQIHKHNAHTGKRYGYLCGVCDHRFEKPNKVRAHARRVHGVPDDQQGPIVRVQL